MEKMPDNADQKKVPVTIITGFLGSGKTTFLNYLLNRYPDTRFAIIENEFGELGVDADMLHKGKIPVYELINGCICCTLNNDFYQALQMISEKHADIDHLLIETTGIADPSFVIDLFVSNENVSSRFELNGVVCLADCLNMEESLCNEPEVAKQIALSDIIILNKTDLLKNGCISELRDLVRTMNPMAKIIETTYAHIRETSILETKAYSYPHIEQTTLSYYDIHAKVGNLLKEKSRTNGLNNMDHATHHINSESFVFDECVDTELFNIWISSFIYFNQMNFYRAKGILYSKKKNKRYIFHAVKGAVVFEEGSEWEKSEEKFSKIVFIGKHIDRTNLSENLEKLFSNYSAHSKSA